MHPVLSHHDFLRTRMAARPRKPAASRRPGFWRSIVQNWKRRRMIAAYDQLDDWILQDIGIVRGDIPRIVDSLCARELDMVPVSHRLAPPPAANDGDAEPAQARERRPDEICRLAA